MKIFLFILLTFPTLALAERPWKCSNWNPVASPILAKTNMRSTLLVLSTPTADKKKIEQDLIKTQAQVESLKKKLKHNAARDGYSLEPVVVKKEGKFQVVLSECWTQTEAASLLLKLDNHSEVQMEFFKEGLYQDLRKEDDCETKGFSIWSLFGL